MSEKTTIESRNIERIPRASLPVVSMDITASAASGYLLLAQPKNNPKSPLIRLRAKVDHKTVASARNQLVEQTLRLRLQQMGQLAREAGGSKPADLWSLSLSGKDKTGKPMPNKDGFAGTVFEGLPTLPVAVSYTLPTTMAAPVRSLNVTLPTQRVPSLIETILAAVVNWLKTGRNVIRSIGFNRRKTNNILKKPKSHSASVPCNSMHSLKTQPRLTPMQELLNSFPTSLQPAVIELSKAIFCLSQAEVDVLVSAADWRTRKLIQMISNTRS